MAEKSVRMEWSSRECECIFIEIKIIFKVKKEWSRGCEAEFL
jgi:hypothetical protein